MIRITVSENKIIIKGHSLYDEYGKDIVCAAVSSTVICTVNGILAIDDSAIHVNMKDGLIDITVLSEDNIINTLIQNMIRCLKELEKKYNKNIMIKEE